LLTNTSIYVYIMDYQTDCNVKSIWWNVSNKKFTNLQRIQQSVSFV